jgi:hypothetical protein
METVAKFSGGTEFQRKKEKNSRYNFARGRRLKRLTRGKIKFAPILIYSVLESWGRCYEHNSLRFLSSFGEKNWRFSQKSML